MKGILDKLKNYFSDKTRMVMAAMILVLLFAGIAVGVSVGRGRDKNTEAAGTVQSSLTEVSGNDLEVLNTTGESADTSATREKAEESLESEESGKMEEQTEDESEEPVQPETDETDESDETDETSENGSSTDSGDDTKPEETNKPSSQSQTSSSAQTQTSQQTQTTQSASAVWTDGSTPFDVHGKLSVSGTHIVDKNGDVFQLKGVSTHGLAWFPQYVNKEAFKTLRDEWGVNMIRLAMYTGESGGYCEGGDQESLKNLIDTGVKAASELGMYVIIDWHVLNDKYPSKYQSEAIAFFDEITEKYAAYDNILYEICNEPNSGPTWSEVKAYANAVIPVIRNHDSDAIIIVGSPTWSQDVDQAAADPITGQTNIVYSLHFYAATHKDDLRNKMVSAISSGLPIIVSEFGICDASGNGSIDYDSANAWVGLMDKYGVSYCIWSLSNKAETCSLIKSSCSKTSGWTEDELSDAAKWYVGILNGTIKGTTPSETTTQTQTQEQTQPTTQEAVTANGNNCSVTAANSNSWGDSSQGYFKQIEVTVKNTGSTAVTDWKVVLKFSGNVTVDSSWNGTVSVSGQTVTITSDADWNKTISSGSSVTPGLIVKSENDVTLESCTIQ